MFDWLPFNIGFAPHIPLWALIACSSIAGVVFLYTLWRRGTGAFARLIALAVLILALANPLMVTETREGLDDVVALVVDRTGEGRVAQLLSDQVWLWARGFEDGGPQAELLRRLAHWLMKEPDLEEERLLAEVQDGELRITRRTMAEQAAEVTVTGPDGGTSQVPLTRLSPGVFSGRLGAERLGLYHLTDGDLNAVAAAGPLNPREIADMRATEEIVAPYVDASGGGIHWLADGTPELREIAEGANASGNGWLGIERRGSYRVTAVQNDELLPPWFALLLVIGTTLFAWRRESR